MQRPAGVQSLDDMKRAGEAVAERKLPRSRRCAHQAAVYLERLRRAGHFGYGKSGLESFALRSARPAGANAGYAFPT